MAMRRRRFMAASGASLAALGAARGWAATPVLGYPRIINGPMLCAPEENAIRVWVRVNGAFEARLEVSETADFDRPVSHAAQFAREAHDFCLVLRADGLQAGRAYFYRVLINGELDRYSRARAPHRARTSPAAGTPGQFTIGFGSCARRQIDPLQVIWRQVAQRNPDLFFWLGDNCYADTDSPAFLREEMRSQRDVALLQPVLRRVPQLAIWDDHDYALNDSDRTNPVREEALGVFRHYWGNPSAGLPDVPGVFFRYGCGGVDFFFLDVRYHRDPNASPDGPGKTMLGEGQLAWLKRSLRESRAPFKCLVSGSGWSMAKGPHGDAWSAFLHERDALFDFLRDEEIAGVLLLSGDTHIGECNVIPWSHRGGYDLYEFVSSPLAQPPADNWHARFPEIRLRAPEAASSNFGEVTFDLGAVRPSATFRLVDTHGQQPWDSVTVFADELRNGVASWEKKIDPGSLGRHQRIMELGAGALGDYPQGFDPQAILR
jgi:alkaline phosphatase D